VTLYLVRLVPIQNTSIIYYHTSILEPRKYAFSSTIVISRSNINIPCELCIYYRRLSNRNKQIREV